ncbi:RTA1 like protein-domain-containing protein [Paraphoma chrysanthemicola]|nr:RTA1 like protein-domain-containing protein [Paraphoma chrysanthemicola]
MAATKGHRTYPLYKYDPSLAAAVIFCILFLLTTILHTYQMWRKRTWFLIPLVIGGYFEFVGYACRSASATQPHGEYTLMPFVVQNSYILLAPALFAATIYMTLGRIVNLTEGNKHSIVSARKLTWVFLLGDIFCFALQGGGGSLMAVGMRSDGQSSLPQIGNYLALSGIILQAFWFVFFIICAALFHFRMRAYPSTKVVTNHAIRWQQYLGSLYLLSGLVLVRSVFRLVEFAQGHDGHLQSVESLFYVFDSVPMLGLMVWMNWQHPGEITLLLRQLQGQDDNVETPLSALT